jgi:transketolase
MPRTYLTAEQKYYRRRILKTSYEQGLSHLGSCLSVVDIICSIYKAKRTNDIFVLSSGHAGIAWYVVLEKLGLLDHVIIKGLSIHPDRDPRRGIHVSSGSLGHGLPIALGMALADRKKTVYCVISDGECAEGSIWEALRIGLEQKAVNLKIVINANGWGAYGAISLPLLLRRIKGFGYRVTMVDGHDMKALSTALRRRHSGQPVTIFARTRVEQFPFLKGLDAHYHTMTAAEYKAAMEGLR